MGLVRTQDELFDLPIGDNGEQEHVPRWLGSVLYGLFQGTTKLLFRYTVDHLERLRAFKGKSGVVLVSNHTSYLDVVFLYCTCHPDQWIRFIARDSLFEAGAGVAGFILARVGAFPIKRDTADLTAVKRAAKMLKRKEVVGIFPEGTRRGKGSKEPTLHAGAAMIAKMGKVPMLPATVREAENIKQKGRGVRFPRVSVDFGHPVEQAWFDELPKDQRLEACTWFAMRECFALSQRIDATQVDMKELFPECPDYAEVADKIRAEHYGHVLEGAVR